MLLYYYIINVTHIYLSINIQLSTLNIFNNKYILKKTDFVCSFVVLEEPLICLNLSYIFVSMVSYKALWYCSVGLRNTTMLCGSLCRKGCCLHYKRTKTVNGDSGSSSISIC